jgi:membrane-bound metal-dependent hydrolase YbcI (DUF457 family)
MATTIAHGLIGISTYCVMASAWPRSGGFPVGFKGLLLAGVAANLPDLDMLVSLLLFSDHKLLHGGITHSFAFAGLMAVLLWLFGRRRGLPPLVAVSGFLLVASHVVVDWFTGPRWGLYPSNGLALFWPFSDTPLQTPVTLFKGVIHGDLLPGALYTAFWELLIVGPPTLGLMYMAYKIQTRQQRLEEGRHDGITAYH